ncbi:hypothetical protein, partial [Methylophaga sp. UBA3991]
MDIRDSLYAAFEKVPTDDRILLIDSFAMACWVHRQGETEAAVKLIRTLLKRVGELSNAPQTKLISKVLSELPGNEEMLANSVSSRLEFR